MAACFQIEHLPSYQVFLFLSLFVLLFPYIIVCGGGEVG